MTTYMETSSPDVLIKMAQAAARNSTLLAHLIEERCQQKNITWAQLAAELRISEMQLAKLALCRQPSTRHFKADVAQAARHARMDTQKLIQFLQPDSAPNISKGSFWQTVLSWPNKSGDQSMIVKRVIAFGIALIAIFFISSLVFSQPNGPAATLQVTNGEVVVQQTNFFNRATTVVVSAGETLTVSSNDTIEVPTEATAELYLFEGSVVELSENTVLELTELAGNSSEHQIYLTLFNGRILNRVTKLLGINDAYEVQTPSSTASVRGTIFSAEVLDENTTRYIVSEGIVAVSMGNETAEVQAGEMVTAVTGQPLNVEPVNSPELLAPPTPNQTPNQNSAEPAEENADSTSDEATTTRRPTNTANPETTETIESPIDTTESTTTPTHTAGSLRPSSTPTTSSPSANTTSVPAASPTKTGGSAAPTNSAPTAGSPTNTRVPVNPTNTSPPTTAATNTPRPVVPTNTPVPPVPTNTPVPIVPTNTPVPPPPTAVPTNTPEPPPPTDEPSTVTLCHNPGPNQQTLQVDASSVQGHLNHGDYLGACD